MGLGGVLALISEEKPGPSEPEFPEDYWDTSVPEEKEQPSTGDPLIDELLEECPDDPLLEEFREE